MAQQISINPVTRIEGHAHISIQLNDAGEVDDAHFHVTQLRGFEKLCEGRPFREMPSLTARVCGICPVSHLIASAKACDELLAVRIPETAIKLRKILNLAQMVQSHALSFFYLSAPDFLLGMDSDPAKRNIFGILEREPEMARGGIRLRQFGQQLIETLAGKRIHPAWVVPGGVNEPLTPEKRDAILAGIPEAKATTQRTLEWFKSILGDYREEISAFANFSTMFMGLVGPDNTLEFYDGQLRMMDAGGNIINPNIPPYEYQDYIGEAAEEWSYLKSPYYRPVGYPDGLYRVGPLARLNIAERAGTPLADAEMEEFKQLSLQERMSSFYFHYARLIEILHGIERIEELLHAPDILDPRVQATASANSPEGVGISEAPRGTLIHHYRIDTQGIMTWANLIIATGNNNLAMDRGVAQAAKHFVKGEKIEEGMLNRVEAVIRAFDPCLSCSTHAVGQMPLHIELLSPDGAVVDQVQR
ncbi:MAG: Ni/Fe hydrogenase subunit alpha [Chloroflexi bacterium]|nr:Ni/Fe hydrogenase subunit alpha [Chloroflexota bacterium]